MSIDGRTLAVWAGAAAAAVAAERLAARRVRGRLDPAGDRLLVPPEDTRHLTLPTPDGGSLHLLERGEGRPVVLLHGVTLNAELWSPQLHGLADEFRVISLDLRGHGRSQAGADRFGLPVLARDLETVLTRLDLRDALVVGHSMGGMAALTFALEHPEVMAERVAGLGLVATAAARPFHPLLAPRIVALGAMVVERLDSGRPVPHYRFTGNDLSLFLCRSAFGRAPSAAAIEQVRASIEAMDPEALQRSLVGITEHDTVERLGQVRAPASVLVGARDILTPPAFARVMADRLPDAELTVLPRAGHQLMQERPDEVMRLIRDLAARAPVAAGDLAPVGA